jgi:hypothetical protein
MALAASAGCFRSQGASPFWLDRILYTPLTAALRAAATAPFDSGWSAQHPIMQHLTVLGFDALFSWLSTFHSIVCTLCVCLVGKVHRHCLCLVTTQPCLPSCSNSLGLMHADRAGLCLWCLHPAQQQTWLGAGSISSSSKVLMHFQIQSNPWLGRHHVSTLLNEQLLVLWQRACTQHSSALALEWQQYPHIFASDYVCTQHSSMHAAFAFCQSLVACSQALSPALEWQQYPQIFASDYACT